MPDQAEQVCYDQTLILVGTQLSTGRTLPVARLGAAVNDAIGMSGGADPQRTRPAAQGAVNRTGGERVELAGTKADVADRLWDLVIASLGQPARATR